MTDTLKQVREALELAQGIGRNNCLDSCSFVKMHREVTQALQILQGKVLVDEGKLEERIGHYLAVYEHHRGGGIPVTAEDVASEIAYLAKEDSDE